MSAANGSSHHPTHIWPSRIDDVNRGVSQYACPVSVQFLNHIQHAELSFTSKLNSRRRRLTFSSSARETSQTVASEMMVPLTHTSSSFFLMKYKFLAHVHDGRVDRHTMFSLLGEGSSFIDTSRHALSLVRRRSLPESWS